MSERGVTRPMALQEGGGGGHDDAQSDRLETLRTHHRQTLWCYWTLIILGVWLCAAPFTFGHLHEANWVRPSGGRGVWWLGEGRTADALRAQLMTWSDVVSGVLLIVFAWRGLRPNRPVSLWICCLIGMWVTFAPVLFWAPTGAAYLSDTIVGMLVIALSILIPGMPNMIMYMQHGPPTPPGWSYNPSSWPQRWIMIATGFAGFVVSRYLAAFQMGYIPRAFDPFFGESSERVLNSGMSHAWPISDGALGTLSYTFEFLMGFMGSPSRWRTMPWMVTFFGVLVIPLGLTHILLVISQPVVVGHWCTFCLLAAAIMLPMIPLEVDEVVAMGQHLAQAKRRGDRGGSLWAVFWKGGSAEGCEPDERSPDLMDLPGSPLRVIRAGFWGMSFPWTLLAASAIGVWFMAQPGALGRSGDSAATLFEFGGVRATSADVFHLAGALVVTCSVIAMGEVVRPLRWLNIPLGLALMCAPWLAGTEELLGSMLGVIGGAAVIALSVPRGEKRETYGSWDRFVR